jgi:hypothetical protein
MKRCIFTQIISVFTFLFFSSSLFSQTPAKWSVNGNATANGDFLGTTNNQPLIFYTNNAEVMRLKPTGELKLNNLSGFGDGLVTINNNGVFGMTAFPGDTTKVFTGAGVYRSIYSISGWKRVGNNVVNNNGAFIGIGTNNPQYILDVNGTVRFSGIVNADGINIVNKLQADTIKGMSMIDVNGNMEFSAGAINEVYTKTGDMRLESRSGFNGNTVLNAGTNGNVGIGIFSPQYKLDVYGDERVNGMIRAKRISALSGDTVIIIGDSTIYFSTSSNKIYHSTNSSVYKGMSIGTATSSGHGLNSLALGTSVWTSSTAINSIVMGSGGQSPLRNDIPNSMMVGFNSDIPTLFIGASSGNSTVGQVGIGTVNPGSDLQIKEGTSRINIGSANYPGILGYLGFNAEINTSGYMHTTGDGVINTGSIISIATDGSMHFNVLPNVAGGNDVLQDPLHFATGAQMRIYNSHVEIGQGTIASTSPYFNDLQTKLMVAGRIMCQDVIVSLVDWQDEVFDSAHTLMSMDSVSAYINTNGHLPGVPAENTIEADGMSVAKTAELQQAKIEEMMLYILQLNERMKALEAENAKLKAAGGK